MSIVRDPRLTYLKNPSPGEIANFFKHISTAAYLEDRKKNVVYVWKNRDMQLIDFAVGVIHHSDPNFLSGGFIMHARDHFMFDQAHNKASDRFRAVVDRAEKDAKKKGILSESLVKHPKFNYYEDPTPREMMTIIQRSREKSIRLLYDADEDILYAWDAYREWHVGFAKTILGMSHRDAMDKTRSIYGGFLEVQADNTLGGFIGAEILRWYDTDLDKLAKGMRLEPTWMLREDNVGKLYEGVVKHPDVTYLEDPSVKQAAAMLKRSKEKSVRFLNHNDTLYMWDSYYFTHFDFAVQILGAARDRNFLNGLQIGRYNGMAYKESGGGVDILSGSKFTDRQNDFLMRFNNYNYVVGKVVGIEEDVEVVRESRPTGWNQWKYLSYLANPTPDELHEVLDKSGSMRLLEWNGNVYAWDAKAMVQRQFITQVLQEKNLTEGPQQRISVEGILNPKDRTYRLGSKLQENNSLVALYKKAMKDAGHTDQRITSGVL